MDIFELRAQIEVIDKKIIDLIATRMEIADALAKAKKDSLQSYWDESKEQEVINRYYELCDEINVPRNKALQIAMAILDASKDRQKSFFD